MSGERDARKNELEFRSRRDRGVQSLKVWLLRKLLKNVGQDGAVKLLPKDVSKGDGIAVWVSVPVPVPELESVDVGVADVEVALLLVELEAGAEADPDADVDAPATVVEEPCVRVVCADDSADEVLATGSTCLAIMTGRSGCRSASISISPRRSKLRKRRDRNSIPRTTSRSCPDEAPMKQDITAAMANALSKSREAILLDRRCSIL